MARTGFYHGSWDDLPVGTVLEPRRDPSFMVERLVERGRPPELPHHFRSVFMVTNVRLLRKAGGHADGGFVYEVEPIGQAVGPLDGGWMARIADHVSAFYGDVPEDAQIDRMVADYWAGVGCRGGDCAGSWEYLAPRARIVRVVRRPEAR